MAASLPDHPDRIEHLNAALRAIRNVNQLIVREKDRGTLVRKACASLVETRGMSHVWIALLDDRGALAEFASMGLGREGAEIAERMREGYRPSCLAEALGTPGIVVRRPPAASCGDCPLAAGATPRGAMAVRLEHAGKAFGVLSVSVPRAFAEDPEEQSLLRELAGDLGFALHGLEEEKRRREAEAAVAESARKFHDIVTQLDEGYYGVTPEGVLLDHNLAFNRILGIELEQDMRGCRLPDFWQDPEDRKIYLNELLSKGIIRNYPIAAKTIRGEEIFVSANSHIVKDERSRPVRIEGTFTDVSDLKRMEAALRESEAKYRSLFENAQIGVFRSKLDGSAILAVNQKFCEMFGYGREEMIGNPGSIRWADPRARDAMVAELRKKGSLFDYEADYVTRSGKVRTCSVSMRLYADQGYLEGSAVDITERKRAEEALRRSEERFRNVFDNSSIGKSITTLDGGVNVNQALIEMLGYSREELGRLRWQEFTHPEDVQLTEEHLGQLLSGEKSSVRFVKRYITKDGSTVWGDLNTVLQKDHAGNPAYYISAVVDITDRKKAEERLKSTLEELRRSNEELERFAYVASHDLQEPLRMVGSYLQLIERRYKGRLDKDADEFIGFAVDGAARMKRMVNDLLQFSRVGTRGKPPEPVDAETALGDALDNLEVAVRESGASVTRGPLPMVLADAGQLVQLFQNLVDNAIKFRKKDEPPRVHISAERGMRNAEEATIPRAAGPERAKRVEGSASGGPQDTSDSPVRPSPSARSADDWRRASAASAERGRADERAMWTFSVRDEGIGIDPKYFDRLFVVFQRLHGPGDYPGTGIGLALCKKIVERHGGRIWLESRPGEGTTVKFTLPGAP